MRFKAICKLFNQIIFIGVFLFATTALAGDEQENVLDDTAEMSSVDEICIKMMRQAYQARAQGSSGEPPLEWWVVQKNCRKTISNVIEKFPKRALGSRSRDLFNSSISRAESGQQMNSDPFLRDPDVFRQGQNELDWTQFLNVMAYAATVKIASTKHVQPLPTTARVQTPAPENFIPIVKEQSQQRVVSTGSQTASNNSRLNNQAKIDKYNQSSANRGKPVLPDGTDCISANNTSERKHNIDVSYTVYTVVFTNRCNATIHVRVYENNGSVAYLDIQSGRSHKYFCTDGLPVNKDCHGVGSYEAYY